MAQTPELPRKDSVEHPVPVDQLTDLNKEVATQMGATGMATLFEMGILGSLGEDPIERQ